MSELTRRDFIVASAATGAALTLPTAAITPAPIAAASSAARVASPALVFGEQGLKVLITQAKEAFAPSFDNMPFSSRYYKFCSKSAALLLFDLLFPAGQNYRFRKSDCRTIAGFVSYWMTPLGFTEEHRQETEIEHMAFLRNVENPQWRADQYQALRADYMRALQTAQDAREMAPDFSAALGHVSLAGRKNAYIGLTDPEFAREIRFFNEMSFWSDTYPTDGPNADLLHQIRHSYLGQFKKAEFSKRDAVGFPGLAEHMLRENDYAILRTARPLQIAFNHTIPFEQAMKIKMRKIL